MATLELFHRIPDDASARARRYVTDSGLEGQVRFRNLIYPEVKRDFAARGGHTAPALWDGKVLIQGLDAVMARLQALNGLGGAP